MTERLKKVLDWFYLGPNPYANQYFRQIVAGESEEREEAHADKAKRRNEKPSASTQKKAAGAAR